MTKNQQTIILVSVIGTILSEYDGSESTKAVRELKFVCERFMKTQSGVKVIPFVGVRIVDPKKHKQFFDTVMIGDTIWRKALDRYAKQNITIEATALIRAVFNFAPELLSKNANISKKRIDALCNGAVDGDESHKRQGCVIGGYLVELLNKEMGIKINGRLGALRAKVENDLRRVA